MSLEKNTPEKENREWERKVATAYRSTLSSIAPIATYLLGIWTFACVLGWLRASSYYSSLGAAWLTPKLNTIDLLSFSVWPIFAFSASLLITFSDATDKKFFSTVKHKLIWGSNFAVLFIFLAAAFYYSYKGDYVAVATIYWSMLLTIALAFGLDFSVIVLALSKNRFRWSSSNILWVSWLCFWFLFSVSQVGKFEGRRDANPEQSQLYFAEKLNGDVLRLIIESDGLIYAAELKSQESPKLTILNHDEILSIYMPTKKAK
jgi:hypothetical protein